MELVEWEGCERPVPKFTTALPWAHSGDEATLDIAARILTAATVEEVLARQDTVEFEKLFDVVIIVHGFRMMPSALDEGIGAYAVIDFTYDGSDKHQITTTSALGVLSQLARIYQLGGFPFACSVMEIETGKKGRNNPLYLCPAELATPFE